MTPRIVYFRFFLLLVSLPAITGAHEDHAGLRHWETATADPDRIFLTFHGDPATFRAVTWRTDTSVTAAMAQIAVAGPGPEFAKHATEIKATTETVDLNIHNRNAQGEVCYHSVVFANLIPDTLYAYRVGSEHRWSEWIQFCTAKAGSEPFSFVYFGDAQNKILEHWSRVIRMSYQKAPDAAFAIHAGDLVNDGHIDREWAEWHKAGGWIHAQRAGIPVIGNHELRPIPGVSEEKLLSILWRPQFTLPEVPDLPPELQETVYTVDYQGVRVIVLNSLRYPEAQATYLRRELQRPGARWTVVTSHYSIFSARPNRGNYPATKLWQPIIEEFGVDLVLQGHDHYYMRGHVPTRTAGEGQDSSLNTLYVTSVSGPKQYEIDPETRENLAARRYVLDAQAEQTQFFQVIEVDGDQLHYTAYTADGDVYDSVTITKDPKSGRKTLQ